MTDPEPRWLAPAELAAWLRLGGVMLKLAPSLDSQLQRDSGLTHFEYLCLAMLSESDERTLAMSELASRTNASLSRLSHVVRKLEERGLVGRCRSRHSGRVVVATLTDQGWDLLVAAAPGHAAHVRSLVFDGLPHEDVVALERISRHVVERIDSSRCSPSC